MTLAQRLLLGALLIVSVVVAIAVVLSGRRLREQLRQLTSAQLAREARLISQQWHPGLRAAAADALADSSGAALGHRVSLVDSGGHVLGDSEFDGAALAALQNHNDRSEIVQARRDGVGSSLRVSPSEGDEELYVAVATDGGHVARVSIGTTQLDLIVGRAQRDVLVSGLVALLVAVVLAAIFSRQISAPVSELRDVAASIAAGDLSRRPAISAPGEVGELATAVHRMSEQLEARMRALQADDNLLGAVVESLNEGVVAVDAQRRVVRINESGRALLRASAPVPFSVDLLPRDRIVQDAVNAALSGNAVERVEAQVGPNTLALTARPLEMGGAVLAFFDLTAQRRLETVRRDFVANVSHELKTPLTAIRGFAETLVSELSSHDQHAKFADTIRANAERMQRLIDDLLDLSRIESGGWVPTPQIIDIADVAAETAAAYAEASRLRGSSIELDFPAESRNFRADPVAVRQALGNLVENAVRYTPAGGTITIFSRSANGAMTIGVRDTGSGISAEHLPRVFERFYRGDPARSRAAGGTGLGLAIVKHLVEAHGGRVRAESTPGEITIISMLFPHGGET